MTTSEAELTPPGAFLLKGRVSVLHCLLPAGDSVFQKSKKDSFKSMQGAYRQAANNPKATELAGLLKFLFPLKLALVFSLIYFGKCPKQNDFPLDLLSETGVESVITQLIGK